MTSDDTRKLNPEWDGSLKLVRGSKFGNKPASEDGYTFDSRGELHRYHELKLELAAGTISHLEVHPVFELIVNGVPICKYEADFSYKRRRRFVVEDVKGKRTDAYLLKRRLMLAVHKVTITEIAPW